MMKLRRTFWKILLPLLGTATAGLAANDKGPLVVTASNAAENQLLVYNAMGKLTQTIPTGGQGGVSGNAGGIATEGGMVAVVNFGSQSVSIFERGGNGL